jgi:hypothetical protein
MEVTDAPAAMRYFKTRGRYLGFIVYPGTGIGSGRQSARRPSPSWTVFASATDVRVGVTVVASVLLIVAPVSAHTTLAQHQPSTSHVTLRAFLLRPAGLLFSLHPTEARVVVTADANEALKVCEDGTTFSRHWTGGCQWRFQRAAAPYTSAFASCHQARLRSA